MAITNYSDLSSAIASWTARTDYTADNYSDFTTLFEAWANRNIRTRNMELTTTLTPSSGSAALPVDYLQWRRVTWTGSPRCELQYVHPTMLSAYYPISTAANPRVFTIEGANLEIRPLDATAIEFDYWQKIPTLVTNSTNWLMTAWPDIYHAGVLMEAYLFNKDPDNATVWASRRLSVLEEIKKLDQASRGPSAIRVFGPTP